MDAEFWASRVAAAKRQNALQPAQSHADQHLSLDDLEGDDDLHLDFPCPFCNVDFDAAFLCWHLEEEHCFEAKNVVCPVCAANVGKDVIGHIRFQHGHLFKLNQKRRFHKGGVPPNSALSVRGKLLRDRQMHSSLGVASTRAGGCSSNAAPDPLLSSFMYSLPIFETEEQEKPSSSMEESSTENSPNLQVTIRLNRTNTSRESLATALVIAELITDSSVSDGDREKMFEEEVQRAEYVQQLVLSTILHDGF